MESGRTRRGRDVAQNIFVLAVPRDVEQWEAGILGVAGMDTFVDGKVMLMPRGSVPLFLVRPANKYARHGIPEARVSVTPGHGVGMIVHPPEAVVAVSRT